MNFRISHRNRMLAISAAALTGITLVGWQTQPFTVSAAANYADTTPNREKRIRAENDPENKLEKNFGKDFEKEFDMNFEKDIRINIDKNFDKDFEKHFDQDFGLSLEMEMKHLEKSLKNIEKINLDKLHNINTDIQLKLNNNDFDELKLSLDRSLKDLEINLHKAGKQIEKATEDMKDMNLDFSESMRAGLEGMEKGKSVMERLQEMINEMDDDKLLNSAADYTVELRDEELYINDKRQPDEVTKKYKKYFSDGNTRIRKKDGNTSVSKRRL